MTTVTVMGKPQIGDRDTAGGLPASPRCSPAVLCLVGLVTLVACGDHTSSAARSQQRALAAAVRVEADGCQPRASIGAGSFVAEEKVITVAHVVAGSSSVRVLLADGTTMDAKVVAIDRRKDIAVLDVDSDTAPLPRGSMKVGASGTFVVYRGDAAVPQPFAAISFVDINAPDIDHEGSSLRRGYQIKASVERGDSGAVLVVDGVATAVVFARSTETGGKAWAVDIGEARQMLDDAGDQPVDVGACP